MKRQISSYKGRKLCLWQKLLLSAVLAGAVTFAGLFGAVLYGSYDHIHDQPEVMIILGCQVKETGPSELLQDRLDKALAYLEDNPDMTIVVSGGQGPDEPTTEARAMADYLMAGGVPEELVRYLENHPADNLSILVKTSENAAALAACAPFTAAYPIPETGAAWYLCENGTCRAPVAEFQELPLEGVDRKHGPQ